MNKNRGHIAIKRNNQANNNKATSRISMSTSILSTSQDRIDIRIPKTSKIYEYLYVDTSSTDGSAWKRLDRLLLISSQKEGNIIFSIWDDFVRRISFFHPEKRTALEKLRPLIFRQILKGEKISDAYWEDIKKL